MRTFGVEEELLLVSAKTGLPKAAAPRILEQSDEDEAPVLEAEFQQEMIEVVGSVCSTADELAAAIAEGRSRVYESAREAGVRALPLATSPLATTLHQSPSERTAEIAKRFGITARDTLTCGLHVHASVESPDEGVGALDRIREWLPLLLALSSNSPFWDQSDTGFASYRSDVWSRWPCTGPNPVFGSAAAYREHERSLLATDVLVDAGMLHFDARLSRHHPTLEIRVADVCLREEDAVTIAVLCRALVESAAQQWRDGIEPIGTAVRTLRLASWQAGRSGMRGKLVHPITGVPCSPAAAVEALLDFAAPGLEAAGDGDRAEQGLRAILERGTGADWQREQFAKHGRVEDIVQAALEREVTPV